MHLSTLVSLETWVSCVPLLADSSPQVPVDKNHDKWSPKQGPGGSPWQVDGVTVRSYGGW